MGKIKNLKNKLALNNKTATVEDKPDSENENNLESVSRKKNLIRKVQFKATKKLGENKSAISKLKKADTSDKGKYEAIKNNLLKEIKQSEKIEEKSDEPKKELNFINRTNRLTNKVLKSIVKNKTDKKVDQKESSVGSDILALKKGQNFSKKLKGKLKKQVWTERINLIKNQLKENADKAKREKTVITGDMKPMIDSLAPAKVEQDSKSEGQEQVLGLTRKEKREKNLERQNAKVIQRQSIRNKTSKEDISLFNQLLDYSEFTKNPIETLKKTFK